ncbi:hypothetical protein BDZ45DRAFT_745673 [Acephala macrosclerotiorum]|nr:hypothetical protein BDZ45DRAFT_745673 [Acephala macrosclerotiorum]
MAFRAFSTLAAELQQLVLQHCEVADLLHLACTSRSIHILVVPVMYRHIDLSYHNDGGLFMDKYGDRMVLGNNPDRDLGDLYDAMQRRQEMFITAINRSPSYGEYVASLTWTYQWKYEEADEAERSMWQAFHSMNRVKLLDICSMDKEGHIVIPPPLFPSATKIRIGGRMSYAFFRAIVSFPGNIEALYIDNVQGLGQVADGIQLYHLGSMNEVTETDGEDYIPVTRHAGPMRGHLQVLAGHCWKLRSLRIRSVGQDNYPDVRWSEQREKARYEEVANFIESVKPTLVSLILDYGTEPDKPYTMPCRGVQGHEHVGRPMDGRFIKYTIPTLSRGPWPNLSTLTIRGIGGTPTQTAIHSYYIPEDQSTFTVAKDGLREGLGKEVTLFWERENTRSFYLLEAGGDHYE